VLAQKGRKKKPASQLKFKINQSLFSGEISPKREIKNQNIENEVILDGFNYKKFRKLKKCVKIAIQCIAMN
jgi:hypothetical protein